MAANETDFERIADETILIAVRLAFKPFPKLFGCYSNVYETVRLPMKRWISVETVSETLGLPTKSPIGCQ